MRLFPAAHLPPQKFGDIAILLPLPPPKLFCVLSTRFLVSSVPEGPLVNISLRILIPTVFLIAPPPLLVMIETLLGDRSRVLHNLLAPPFADFD